MNNPFKKTTEDQFSNEALQKFVESLDYFHAESNDKAWELTKIKQIESKSIVWARIISSLDKFKLGNFRYHVTGNRLERAGPSIKVQNKSNPLVRLSSKFRIKIKQKVKPKGVVTVK